MNPELHQKLNAIAATITALTDELRIDPSVESQWTVAMLESTLSGMNMRLGNQYGLKLNPRLPVEAV